MTPRPLLLLLLALAALLAPLAAAAACDDICYTTELTGFSAGGVAGCSCSGSGASRSGSGGCQCGSCYYKQSDGTVLGYAVSSSGTCTFGVNCGDCDYASTSASASVSASGSAGSSTSAHDSVANSGSASAGSAGSADAGGNAGSSTSSSSTTTSSSSSGLKTWQIALIICSVVLVFGVACISILTCYCKAKRRLEENEDEFDEHAGYMPHGPTSGSHGSGYANPGGFPRRSTNPSPYGVYAGGSMKGSPPLGEPMVGSYSASLEATPSRIGMGMRPNGGSNGDLAGMRPNGGSNGDLAGMYSADRRPSQGSFNLATRRPSTELYSTRDRDALAVEL